MIEFESIEAFYLTRGGARSGEADFGVMWRGGERRPHYRVTVVHDTGDVFAERTEHGEGPLITVLGTLPHNCGGGKLRILTHDKECAYTVAERVLHGWTEHIFNPHSLEWVREQLADWTPAPVSVAGGSDAVTPS